jgi:hypothetical protein
MAVALGKGVHFEPAVLEQLRHLTTVTFDNQTRSYIEMAIARQEMLARRVNKLNRKQES